METSKMKKYTEPKAVLIKTDDVDILTGSSNGIELPESTPVYNGGATEQEQPLLYFSDSNKASADALPSDDELTTEYFATVTTLRYILSNCEDFEGKQAYVIKLDKAYNRILEIQAEIDALKEDIKKTWKKASLALMKKLKKMSEKETALIPVVHSLH